MRVGIYVWMCCCLGVWLYAASCAAPLPPKESPKEKAEETRAEIALERGADAGEPRSEPAENEPTPEPDGGSPEIAPEPPDRPSLPRPTEGWCARITAGGASSRAAAIALSWAHSKVRFFGVHQGYPSIDGVLAKALAQHPMDDPRLLLTYANAEASICALPADARGLGAASVKLQGDVAIVRPGTGTIELPEGTRAVALDLRDLPASPLLAKAIDDAIALVLAKPLARSGQMTLLHDGMADQYFNQSNSYKNTPTLRKPAVYAAKAPKAMPLAVIVGESMAPAAARAAGDLRLARRAWLIGAGVLAAVAESHWVAVGKAGLAFRTMVLSHDGTVWPDRIPADATLKGSDAFLASLSQRATPEAVVADSPQRSQIKAYSYFRAFQDRDVTLANVQAALLIAHGALRLFYPYFHVVGDTIDKRLLETLGEARRLTLTGVTSRHLLRRFGEAIHDGHCFVYSLAPSYKPVGYLLVEFDQLDGKPVIRRTKQPGLKVGDTLLSIDGVAAADWWTQEYKRTSAATPGYRFDLAARELAPMYGPRTLEVQGADGMRRTVKVEPQTVQAYQDFLGDTLGRKHGFLKDLGAPEVYYVDLSAKAVAGINVAQVAQTLQTAKGLVLDMRGYPGPNAWTLLQHLVETSLPSPLFLVPTWHGVSQRRIDESKYELPARQPQYKGPIAFLIGPRSVSQAEHLGTMLKQAGRVTFVGRASAGTNGNITGLALPSSLVFTFTGMEILLLDRTPFHGVGLVPKVQVAPTPQDLAKGYDRVLAKAIEELKP